MTEEYQPPPEEVQTRESDTVMASETREISDALIDVLTGHELHSRLNGIITQTRQTGNEHGFVGGIMFYDNPDTVIWSDVVAGTKVATPMGQALEQIQEESMSSAVIFIHAHTHPPRNAERSVRGLSLPSSRDIDVWKKSLETADYDWITLYPSEENYSLERKRRLPMIIVNPIKGKNTSVIMVLHQTEDEVDFPKLRSILDQRTDDLQLRLLVSAIYGSAGVQKVRKSAQLESEGFMLRRFVIDEQMGTKDPVWQEFTSHLKAIFPRELAFHQDS